jgi:hypothetical protein
VATRIQKRRRARGRVPPATTSRAPPATTSRAPPTSSFRPLLSRDRQIRSGHTHTKLNTNASLRACLTLLFLSLPAAVPPTSRRSPPSPRNHHPLPPTPEGSRRAGENPSRAPRPEKEWTPRSARARSRRPPPTTTTTRAATSRSAAPPPAVAEAGPRMGRQTANPLRVGRGRRPTVVR